MLKQEGWCEKKKIRKRGGGKEKVSKEKLQRSSMEGNSCGAGRKEGYCKGKAKSFPSNPHEDSPRCQKNVARH